jgi:hypothetical protein
MRPDPAGFNFWLQVLPGPVLFGFGFGFGMTITVTPLTSTVLAAIDTIHSDVGSAINNAVSRIAGRWRSHPSSSPPDPTRSALR